MKINKKRTSSYGAFKLEVANIVKRCRFVFCRKGTSSNRGIVAEAGAAMRFIAELHRVKVFEGCQNSFLCDGVLQILS